MANSLYGQIPHRDREQASCDLLRGDQHISLKVQGLMRVAAASLIPVPGLV